MSRRAVPIRPLNQRCYSPPLLVLIAVTKATRPCRRTHACTSMSAWAATRRCARNQATAASFARTAASPAPRFSSSEARMTQLRRPNNALNRRRRKARRFNPTRRDCCVVQSNPGRRIFVSNGWIAFGDPRREFKVLCSCHSIADVRRPLSSGGGGNRVHDDDRCSILSNLHLASPLSC